MTRAVAIVGAGPSGVYAAERLLRADPPVRVDVLDRLAAPWGLARSGVAPDHQGTKRVARRFSDILSAGGARLLGNVPVTRDGGAGSVSLAELRRLYDAVILAVGMPADRRLNIPGEDLPGVVGSGVFTGWYNGHPDHADAAPLDATGAPPERAVVIGHGNVALDVARMLMKGPQALAETDAAAPARAALASLNVRSVHVAGRRGPTEAGFTPPELREMSRLEEAAACVDGAAVPESLPPRIAPDTPKGRMRARSLEILRQFSPPQDGMRRAVTLLFQAAPKAILGDGRVTGVRFARTRVDADGKASETGEMLELPADLVVTAIGYQPPTVDLLDAPRNGPGRFPNRGGHIEENLYVVGWAKRGPSGTIPTNRGDSHTVADMILNTLGRTSASAKAGPGGLDALLRARGIRAVTLPEWLRIDAAETARATPPAPREKFLSNAAMLAALDG